VDDKYLQYQLEDFLVDDNFVDWVVDDSNDKKWLSWLNKNPSASNLITEAKKSVGQLKFKNDNDITLVKQKTWKRISASTQAKEVKLNTSGRRSILGLIAAASIVLLAIFLMPQSDTTIETSLTQSEDIVLPSASKVTLGAASQLTYKDDNWNTERNVALSGQAHFKVSKGVPFNIDTDNGKIQVLGTEFEVLSRQNAFQVLVTEGRVKVSSSTFEKVLTAGMAFYKNPEWQDEKSMDDLWKSTDILFVFNDQPLKHVLRALTSAYGVSFIVESIDDNTSYTGSFETTSDIEVNLEKILWPLRIHHEISNGTIILSSKE